MEYMKYLLIVVAYLLGSIPTALILGKVTRGIDLRQHGSGNLGTTNTFRVLGFWPGIICLFVDIFKGSATILFIRLMDINVNNTFIIICGVAAIIGHAFPIFAGFKGGKSVATSLGMSIAITPIEVLIGVGAFIVTLFLFGFVSVSSTIAALVIGTLVWFWQGDMTIKIFYSFIVLFIVVKHYKNYVRLLKGTENKVSFLRKRKK